MNRIRRNVFTGMLGILGTVAIILACGTPPSNQPPPPPPAPPIVCCIVIDWFTDPTDPNFECLIIRYFRHDGLPLYQSNPMPLLPTQRCLCQVPNLPIEAIAAGAVPMGFVFGGQPPCQSLPPNQPGYGPFLQVTDPSTVGQVNQFVQAYAAAAGDVEPPNNPMPNVVMGFAGPGTIPPNVFFDIYQKLRVPRGFDPRLLCRPAQMWMIGVFLQDGTQVFAEPIQPGLPPIPFPQFQQNPGNSAFYKFKWYPLIVPPPCPPVCHPPGCCPADINGNGTRSAQDIFDFLAFYFAPVCP